MPIIFGWLAGDLFGRAFFSRIVTTFLMWCGVGLIGWKIGAANFSIRTGTVFAALSMGGLLAWSLYRPAGSRTKLWLIEGLLVMIFAAQVVWGILAILVLLHARSDPSAVGRAVMPVLVVVGFWALRAALLAWVRRSADLLGARSVVRSG